MWVVGHVTPQRRVLLVLASQLMLNFDSPYHDNLYWISSTHSGVRVREKYFIKITHGWKLKKCEVQLRHTSFKLNESKNRGRKNSPGAPRLREGALEELAIELERLRVWWTAGRGGGIEADDDVPWSDSTPPAHGFLPKHNRSIFLIFFPIFVRFFRLKIKSIQLSKYQ